MIEETLQDKIKANREELRRQYELRKSKMLREERKQQRIRLVEWIFVLSLFGGGFIYYSYNFIKSSMHHLSDVTELGQTVHQVSQLIDNIRLVYASKKINIEDSMDKLVEIGAIPSSLIKDGHVVNNYGGDIVVKESFPLKNVKEEAESPTFKMSYQGLSKKTCIDLAMMDWGDKIRGLLAVSIGFVDDMGNDKALNDIDRKLEEEKPRRFIDTKGRIRIVRPRRQYQFNVAKPQDTFHPTPFARDDAEYGCDCGYENNCSFAWHYTIFAVDNPRKVDSAFAVQQKLKKALRKKFEEKAENKDSSK